MQIFVIDWEKIRSPINERPDYVYTLVNYLIPNFENCITNTMRTHPSNLLATLIFICGCSVSKTELDYASAGNKQIPDTFNPANRTNAYK